MYFVCSCADLFAEVFLQKGLYRDAGVEPEPSKDGPGPRGVKESCESGGETVVRGEKIALLDLPTVLAPQLGQILSFPFAIICLLGICVPPVLNYL